MNYAARFVIINTIDAPSQLMVAELLGDAYYYMHPKHSDFGPMRPNRPTPIEDFGFEWLPEGQVVIFRQTTTISNARYDDGGTRRWQGDTWFELPLAKKARRRKGR